MELYNIVKELGFDAPNISNVVVNKDNYTLFARRPLSPIPWLVGVARNRVSDLSRGLWTGTDFEPACIIFPWDTSTNLNETTFAKWYKSLHPLNFSIGGTPSGAEPTMRRLWSTIEAHVNVRFNNNNRDLNQNTEAGGQRISYVILMFNTRRNTILGNNVPQINYSVCPKEDFAKIAKDIASPNVGHFYYIFDNDMSGYHTFTREYEPDGGEIFAITNTVFKDWYKRDRQSASSITRRKWTQEDLTHYRNTGEIFRKYIADVINYDRPYNYCHNDKRKK